MEVTQIQFNFWIFFSNALCALALNFSIFLVIGRTGAVTIRVAGVLKDWILIALSTLIFPESTITTLNITGYAIGKLIFPYLWELSAYMHHIDEILFCIALCGVVMYNYLKVKDVRASQLPVDTMLDRTAKVRFCSDFQTMASFSVFIFHFFPIPGVFSDFPKEHKHMCMLLLFLRELMFLVSSSKTEIKNS